MGRPSNTVARRRQIVEGLLSAMAEHGYQRSSIQAIAKAAGLAPGLVHYHFKSKQQILLALLDELTQRLQQRTQGYLDKAAANPWGQLDAWIDGALALASPAREEDRRTLSAWVFIGTEALRQPEVQQVYERVTRARLESLRLLVAAVLKQQGQSARSAKKLAAYVLSTVEGAYQLGCATPDALPQGFAAPLLKRALRGLTQ